MRRRFQSSVSSGTAGFGRTSAGRLLYATAALWGAGLNLPVTAQITLDAGASSLISADVHKRMDPEFRQRLPGASATTIERAEEAFIDHLHTTSERASSNLADGHIEEDDLTSRIDVFLGDHLEFGRVSSNGETEGPRTQILAALKKERDLAQSDAEREALADRFLVWIGGLSGSARDTLLAGRMPADELQSRIKVFAADIRAERIRVVTDPAVAAVPAIADAFARANLGPVTERADSVCYKATASDGKSSREFVAYKKRPDNVRLHIMRDGFVVAILAYDGSRAWGQAEGKPPSELKGSGAEVLLESSRFDYPLIGYRERGAKARLVSVPGESPIRISLEEPSGDKYVESLDSATYHEIGVTRTRPDGKVDELRMSDFHKEGSYTYAAVEEHRVDGKVVSTTRISEVRLDPGLLNAFFRMPSAAKFSYMDMMGGLAALQATNKKSSSTISLPSTGISLPPAGNK
jgi:hypothetical protein